MLMTAEFWVAVAFVMFGAVVLYAGAHKTILSSLDGRAARIKAELEDASRLKQEAAALLAEYKQKTGNAEQEAAAIIEGAKADAERLAAEAHAKLEDFVARRTKMAEAKIAQAETQALADVRSIAADVAASAAEKVMTLAAKGALAEQLIARGIEDVKKKLN
jgi:F-type H+-transporting ATPase subunit b